MAVRRWDFRSWARLGRPIAREYAEPETHQVAILVDTFAEVRPGERTTEDFEQVLSLAASVCDALGTDGFRVTGLALGPALADYSASADANPMSSILDQLAVASPIPMRQLDDWVGRLQPALRPGLPIIVVLSREDEGRLAVIRGLRRAVANVTVMSAASAWDDPAKQPFSRRRMPSGRVLEQEVPAP
jgi:uncharacterized protein (DUF58 family)